MGLNSVIGIVYEPASLSGEARDFVDVLSPEGMVGPSIQLTDEEYLRECAYSRGALSAVSWRGQVSISATNPNRGTESALR